jgi:SAM-dependent methyltransferase
LLLVWKMNLPKWLREIIPVEHQLAIKRRWRRIRRPAWMGTLRRTDPISDYWGLDRGTPVDRFFIEHFLRAYRADIHGRVLEIRDSRYTDQFGQNLVEKEVLDIDRGNPQATIVADLARADQVASDSFDCFVLTQTLQYIYELRPALAHAHRILRPGGVLLATAPGISRIKPGTGLIDEYWRFTAGSCRALVGEAFGAGSVTVHSYGNVLTAIAFLTGISGEELSARELEAHDPYYPVIIAVRAVKKA